MDRIHVHHAAAGMSDVGRRTNRLDDPGFVVGRHDGDQGALTIRGELAQPQIRSAKIDDASVSYRNFFNCCGAKASSGPHRGMLD